MFESFHINVRQNLFLITGYDTKYNTHYSYKSVTGYVADPLTIVILIYIQHRVVLDLPVMVETQELPVPMDRPDQLVYPVTTEEMERRDILDQEDLKETL